MTDSLTVVELLRALGTAIACGAVIGAEREWTRHDAGIRTNTLVALGACLFGLASLHVYPGPDGDSGRVAAQVVSGIGFIGAGVIIQRRARVMGLTTAATLWVAAAVGLAAGGGHLELAWAGAIAALLVQVLLRGMELRLDAARSQARGPLRQFELVVRSPKGLDRLLSRILAGFTGSGVLHLREAAVEPAEGHQQLVRMVFTTREPDEMQELKAHLAVAGYTIESLAETGIADEKGQKRGRRRRSAIPDF